MPDDRHQHEVATRAGPSCDLPPPPGDGAPANAFRDRIFEYRRVERSKLVLVMAITAATMVVEVIGGLLTGSISLISDAGHMFTHAFAIVISLVAIWIAGHPPCHHRTYGLFRAEILAAFVNSLFLFLVTAFIVAESVRRLLRPVEVRGWEMFGVAVFGLAVNLITMLILHGHHHHDLNVRGVFLHLLADTLSSVAIVAGAVVIQFTGMNALDPLIGIGISAAILVWAWGLCRESSRILLEMTPRTHDVDSLGEEIKAAFPEVRELYNVHLWAITSDMYVFTAHLRLRDDLVEAAGGREVVRRVNAWLRDRLPVIESTIQWIE